MSEGRAPGTRKPYRISKPREKWTDSEHDRFVTAINQHGRNWKKIVQEVGTRSVAQVRSHAQKYFLKLEKNGNTEEVPPARAKRPSNKPYPIKNSTNDGSHPSSQSSQPHESKRPRRTERAITRPLHTDFTLLEESPGMSTDRDSLALLLNEEGDGSNNNVTDAAAVNKYKSNSNGTGGSMTQRQSSALSTADLGPTDCLVEETGPSPDSKLSPEALFAEEHSGPADASSGAVIKTDPGSPPNYGEFYNAVGKVFTNHQGSNRQLLQQLGASKRSELVHMLDHLSGEMRDRASPGDMAQFTLPSQDKPSDRLPTALQEPGLQNLPPGHVMSQLQGSYSPPGSMNEGVTSSNHPFMESEVHPILGQSRADQSGSLLQIDPQPSDLDSADWRLGMSDDLGNLLPSPAPDYGPYQPSPLIDSKVFDY